MGPFSGNYRDAFTEQGRAGLFTTCFASRRRLTNAASGTVNAHGAEGTHGHRRKIRPAPGSYWPNWGNFGASAFAWVPTLWPLKPHDTPAPLSPTTSVWIGPWHGAGKYQQRLWID